MEYITRNNYVIKHDCDNCKHDKCCKYRDIIDELEVIADRLEDIDDIDIQGNITCEEFLGEDNEG